MAVLRLQLYKTHSNTNCYQGHLKSDHYFPVGPAARRGLPARSRSLAGLPPTMLHTGQPVISGNNVSLKIEQSRQNSRIVRASVSIRSPLEDVWEALTGYETLHTFIPGLKENRCLKRWETGAEILQVGQQDIVAGFKFTARSILLVEEHMHGIPKDWQSDEIISPPRSWLVKKRRDQSWNSQTSNAFLQNSRWQTNADVRKSSDCAYRDISFQQVEGDFQVFKGLWRMHRNGEKSPCTSLSYHLFVRPQIWLPIGLIQGRIEKEIVANLGAVRSFVEVRQS